MRGKWTFMVGQDAAGDLYLCSWCLGRQVGRCGLEEEEGLFRNRVVELLDVVEVVAADGDDLGRVSEGEEERGWARSPFFRA